MSETIGVSIKAAKELARQYMYHDIPSFMSGAPGIGKTDAWKQIAEEEGIGFIHLELTQMDPVDLRGLPHFEDGLTKWARPDMWPTEADGECGIILFDEMADLSRAMQTAAYSPILYGRSGPHVIPPFNFKKRQGWYRAAAGNRREDKAAAQAMSTALASRFGWIDVDPDLEAFVEWGYKSDIDAKVIGFLRWRPAMLHSMEGADLRAFPCPRQWSRVSRVCNAPANLRFNLIRGLVGDGVATEWEAYMRTMDLPDFEDIMADPKKCPIPKAPGTKYALASMLSRNAKRENFEKIITYTKRDDFGRDFEIVTILDAAKRDTTLTDTRAFVDFSTRHQEVVM
jgi:hypothetical protein